MIPDKVKSMLRSNGLVHLATCKDNVPSASLMNFTLVEEPYKSANGSSGSAETVTQVILATPRDTTKYRNLSTNPNVSLLLNDFHSGSSEAGGLAQYLQRLNQSELTQQSVTLGGTARLPEGEEAEYYRQLHLKAHPEANCFIVNAAVVLVELHGARIADSSNRVESF